MLDLARVAYLVNLDGGAAERLRGQLPGPERVECVEWPVRGPDTRNRPDR